jgi:2-dehydro-3-deoxygluconokinase
MVATADRREMIPGRPVKAVDATGAGDMFDGAFLAEWLLHRDPFRAAAYANAAAALSTLGRGAVAPMPRRTEVEAFLKSGA